MGWFVTICSRKELRGVVYAIIFSHRMFCNSGNILAILRSLMEL